MADDEALCPICCNELSADDKRLIPCKCGFQICLWCLHKMMEGKKGKCPQCRSPYDEANFEYQEMDREEIKRELKKKKKRDERKSNKFSSHRKFQSRDHLKTTRVIQRNLVYVIGLAPKCANESTLRRHHFFGQYGSIVKIVVNRSYMSGGERHHNSASAYITYKRNQDALLCIMSCDGFVLEGRTLKASFGTTKYCNAFLRGSVCNNPDCLYLHELGLPDDSFAKDKMAVSQGRFQQQINPGRGGAGRAGPNSGTAKDGLPSPHTTKMGRQFKAKSKTTKRAATQQSAGSTSTTGTAWKTVADAAPSASSHVVAAEPSYTQRRGEQDLQKRSYASEVRGKPTVGHDVPVPSLPVRASSASSMPLASTADPASSPSRTDATTDLGPFPPLASTWSNLPAPGDRFATSTSDPRWSSGNGFGAPNPMVPGGIARHFPHRPLCAASATESQQQRQQHRPSYGLFQHSIWGPNGGCGSSSVGKSTTADLTESSNALKAFLGIGTPAKTSGHDHPKLTVGAGAAATATTTTQHHNGDSRRSKVGMSSHFGFESSSSSSSSSSSFLRQTGWPTPSTSASLSSSVVSPYRPHPSDVFESVSSRKKTTLQKDMWSPLRRPTPPRILRGGPVGDDPERNDETDEEAARRTADDVSRLVLWAMGTEEEEKEKKDETNVHEAIVDGFAEKKNETGVVVNEALIVARSNDPSSSVAAAPTTIIANNSQSRSSGAMYKVPAKGGGSRANRSGGRTSNRRRRRGGRNRSKRNAPRGIKHERK